MRQMKPGPLVFAEVFKAKPWGGRALARLAGKRLPPGEPVGESWEVADHPHGMSVVAEGPLAGKTLRELMRRHGGRILGRAAGGERFPLLVKLLDARERLSVQVHPDDAVARVMGLKDPGKTEAWYVLESRDDGRIIAGLRSRRALETLREDARSGALEGRVKTISPEAHDCWLCKAGAVHALGPGVALLEIQQNSDSTFRLYDWQRAGLDGKPRELHIEESIQAINGRVIALSRARPRPLKGLPFDAERLVACDQFVIDRWTVATAAPRRSEGRFEILHVVDGTGVLRTVGWPDVRLKRGRSVLVPACVMEYELLPRRTLRLVRTTEGM